jgi:outer membrane immunogenic protein
LLAQPNYSGGLDNERVGSMKKLLLASVSLFALAGMAQGADMAPIAYKAPPPPVANWAGFYVGVDGGVARHDAVTDDLGGLFNMGSYVTSQTGGVLGGYAGVNFQDRSFVYGFEADVNWVGAKATQAWGGVTIFDDSAQQSQDVPWLATFRGRMGIDYESTLFYVTGGLAVGKVNNSYSAFCSSNFACNGAPAGGMFASFNENTTRLGWTAGVGVEHMFASHWTVRGEARYVDLGRKSVSCMDAVPGGCNAPAAAYRGEFSNTLMTGLFGLGYKF